MSELRVVIWKEGAFFIGQGLERDLCVQAKSPEDVRRRMDLQVRVHAKNGDLEAVPQAPQWIRDLWDGRQHREIVDRAVSADVDLRLIFDFAAAA